MGDEASLTNLNAGRDKILFYYRRVNCAINNDMRQDSILFGRKKTREAVWFCYIFSGIRDDDSRVFRLLASFFWVNLSCAIEIENFCFRFNDQTISNNLYR